jgi:hypothetical protein
LAKIKIIATPSGEAPEWVRKEWIGLELPVVEVDIENGIQFGVVKGGPPQNLGGYSVETTNAIKILKEQSPEAAQWWLENPLLKFMDVLVFKKEFCELIEE